MAHIGQFALEAHAAMRGLPPFKGGELRLDRPRTKPPGRTLSSA